MACHACMARLQTLRSYLNALREENGRLMLELSQLSSSYEQVDEAASCCLLSSSNSARLVCTDAAESNFLPFLNKDADNPSYLQERIMKVKQEWKLLAERYNVIVDELQESEQKLFAVAKNKCQVESLNKMLLERIQLQWSSLEWMDKSPSSIQVMHRASPTSAQSILDKNSMKSPQKQKDTVAIECAGQCIGLVNVHLSNERPGQEYGRNSASACASPAYTFRDRTHGRNGGFDLGEDTGRNLFHSPTMILSQVPHLSHGESASMNLKSATENCCPSEGAHKALGRRPLKDLQCLNSAPISYSKLSSISSYSVQPAGKGERPANTAMTLCSSLK